VIRTLAAAAPTVAAVTVPVVLALGATLLLAPRLAEASFANELPRAEPVLSFHPRADAPFTLDQLRRALRAGVHGAELDLRWRSADSTVVCSHSARNLRERPSLAAALDAILKFQGASQSVQRDGRQFYVTLDLKDQGAAYHRAILGVLRQRAKHWSTAVRPGEEPRGITIVVSASRAAFERVVPSAQLDSLCLIEREDATLRGRILDLSDRDGPLAWVALEHPTTHERIQAIHEGRDAQFGGRFNVRVYAAGKRFADAIAMGADAVNVDLEDIAAARGPANTAARAAAKFPSVEAGFWTFQAWKVDSPYRPAFEAAWRKRADARRARATGWRGEILLRSETDAAVYRAIERWENEASWNRVATGSGPLVGTGLLDALRTSGDLTSAQKMLGVEDRFGGGPAAGDHVRIYRITARPRLTRAFHRAWNRAHVAIRETEPAALGAALLQEPGRTERIVEIVRWKSEAACRRFIESPPPDEDADAAIRAAVANIVTERYRAVAIAP